RSDKHADGRHHDSTKDKSYEGRIHVMCSSESPCPAGLRPPNADGHLLVFKSLAGEPQRPPILRYRSDHLIRCAQWHFGFDLECHPDFRAHESNEMGDHLIGYAPRVAPDARGIQAHSAVIALRLLRPCDHRPIAVRCLPHVARPYYHPTLLCL